MLQNLMSRIARRPIFVVPTISDTNHAVQPQKIARGFGKLRHYTIYVAKTKALTTDLRL